MGLASKIGWQIGLQAVITGLLTREQFFLL